MTRQTILLDRHGQRWAVRTFLISVLATLFVTSSGNHPAAEHLTPVPPLVLLPCGEQAPNAFTEQFLSQRPQVALCARHLAILRLEPAGTPEGDTGIEEGVDQVPYFFEQRTRLRLQIHPSATYVQRLVLKDRFGRKVAHHEHGRKNKTTVTVFPGVYFLEAHHTQKGQANAPEQLIFLRPVFFNRAGPRPVSHTVAPRVQEQTQGAQSDVATLEASANCQNCNFANADLEGEDWSGAILSDSTFFEVDLGGALFTNAIMRDCTFEVTSFTSTPPGTTPGTNFTHADLTGSNFIGVEGENVSFAGAILDQTTWGVAVNPAGSAAILPVVMSGTDFSGASLNQATFSGANLDGSIFHGAILDGAVFARFTPPSGAAIFETSCQACDFSNAVSPTGIRIPTHIRNTIFSFVDFFDDATGAGALFTAAFIQDSTFAYTDLRSAGLASAFVEDTTFEGVTNLSNAQVPNTYFNRVYVQGADTVVLDGINFSTVFPFFYQTVGLKPNDILFMNPAGFNFSGLDLSRAQLSKITIAPQRNPAFPVQDLPQANFVGAVLSDVNAHHGVTLAGRSFPDGFSQFQGQNLSYADLSRTSLVNANFQAATLIGTNLSGAELLGANLQGANLTNAQLVGANLNSANLINAKMRGLQAGVAAGSGVPAAATFSGALLIGADLSNADLRSADLNGAHIYKSSKNNALLTGALLDSANFSSAILTGTAFSGSMNDTEFNSAQMVNCTFNGATLTNAKFDNAYLQGADFTGALSVVGASFKNAAFSSQTQCLAGCPSSSSLPCQSTTTCQPVCTPTTGCSSPCSYCKVFTPPCEWTYGSGSSGFVFTYGATVLAGLAKDTSIICPDATKGACSGSKLIPQCGGPIPPQPFCIPKAPDFCNCIPAGQPGSCASS